VILAVGKIANDDGRTLSSATPASRVVAEIGVSILERCSRMSPRPAARFNAAAVAAELSRPLKRKNRASAP